MGFWQHNCNAWFNKKRQLFFFFFRIKIKAHDLKLWTRLRKITVADFKYWVSVFLVGARRQHEPCPNIAAASLVYVPVKLISYTGPWRNWFWPRNVSFSGRIPARSEADWVSSPVCDKWNTSRSHMEESTSRIGRLGNPDWLSYWEQQAKLNTYPPESIAQL